MDGQAAICAAMDVAFRHAGLTAPDHRNVRRIVGLSLPHAVRQLAPDAGPDAQAEVVAAYKQAYRQARVEGQLEEPLFEGIGQLLRRLRSAGWLLGVATGKSDRGLHACLQHHGLSDLFITLQTADRHPSKPHPAMLEAALFEAGAQPDQAVMIGDTTFDIEMARAANVRAVGVDWGYHAAQELSQAGAAEIASNSEQLEALL